MADGLPDFANHWPHCVQWVESSHQCFQQSKPEAFTIYEARDVCKTQWLNCCGIYESDNYWLNFQTWGPLGFDEDSAAPDKNKGLIRYIEVGLSPNRHVTPASVRPPPKIMTKSPTQLFLPPMLTPIPRQNDKLAAGEVYWRDNQPCLNGFGYILRPRYQPDWIPSWMRDKSKPHSQLLAGYRRNSRRGWRFFYPQTPSKAFISRKPAFLNLYRPKRNATPDADAKVTFIMRLMRSYDSPRFDACGEAVEFFRQQFKPRHECPCPRKYAAARVPPSVVAFLADYGMKSEIGSHNFIPADQDGRTVHEHFCVGENQNPASS
ncbi:hypothetical protein DFH09DRAFT_1089747 [Mycena vulgaris]|nr:hypothetical protein DFH09DRAFT_1089747 [Mycena vulgaris]